MVQASHVSLILPPLIGVAVWALLSAVGLPAFATIAGGAVFLAIYVRLAMQLVQQQQRTDQLNEVTKAVDIAGKARRLAILDPATDLLARWYFELRLEEEAVRCLRYKEEAAVVVLRPPEDNPLTENGAPEVAGHALRGVRKTDLVGSQEEGFALCLIHCDRDHAEIVAGRLAYRLGAGWRFGVATIPEEAQTGKEALLLANTRLTERHVYAA